MSVHERGDVRKERLEQERRLKATPLIHLPLIEQSREEGRQQIRAAIAQVHYIAECATCAEGACDPVCNECRDGWPCPTAVAAGIDA